MRLIDADRLIEDMSASALPIMVKGISEITGDESCIVDHINNAPTIYIDDAHITHGYWEDVRTSIVCSVCGAEFADDISYYQKYPWTDENPKYCPDCGARMDGDPHDSGQ